MKFILPIICFILNALFAEIYPLAQKPFLEGLNPSDGFARGTFLIVVASSDLEDILDTDLDYIGNFIHFKQTQGFDVEVWNFQDYSDKENLRDSLETYYSNNPLLEYVLLIGDYDPDPNDYAGLTYPLDSFTISSYNEPQQDVTDLPFTYFEGDPTTNDGLNPNFFIGRWSISSLTELMTIQKKTIQYTKLENVDDLSYLDRALIVAGSYKTENSAETYPFKWPVSPVWTSLWLQNKLNHFGYSIVDTAFYYLGNMQSSDRPTIINSWDNGVGVINYRGWGNAQGWVKPQFFIDPDLINLSNNYALPVVFSFVCNTGDFGNDIEPSFGEKMVRMGSPVGQMKGAVAMVGPSDLDTDTRFNNVMCGALWDGLLEGRTPELAQALHAAKQAVAKEFKGISETGLGGTQDIPVFYHHVYGVLGDPSLPVWLSQPTDLSVLNDEFESIDGILQLSDKFINIVVQDSEGQSVQDVVGALLYNGELIAKGLSTIDGNLDIDFTDISDITVGSELELYLNKAQFFQKNISVTLSEDNSNVFGAHSYSYQLPESPDYYDVNTIEYNWIELNSEKGGIGENVFLTDDEIVADVPIGFDFTYYGYTYTTVNICSNGWVSFEKSTIPYFWNFSIPFPMGPPAMLAVFMDDLDDNGKEPFGDENENHIYDSGDVFITDCGTPENPSYPCHDYNQDGNRKEGEPFNVFKFQDTANHRFIVQWDELSNAEDDENCGTSTGCVKETFQMMIYENGEYGQGNIVFQYKEIHDIDDGRVGKNGNLSTIGIESPDQNLGIQYLFRGSLWDGTTLPEGGLDLTAIQFSANQEIISNSGSFLATEFVEQPSNFKLIGAYPNPFNPTTTVRYSLSEFSWINLNVYNIRGQKLTTLYNGTNIPGEHSVVWNASNYASGVYFISLKTHGITTTQKVLLLK
ncbi:T9SS C-terminal target domain-containing protein [Candidatus Marinimicrobia bacterium PRS2]|nr:T9SS C-terminal target domain-containing protein [Candidatus Marinimicrobia bacterium PRS2]